MILNETYINTEHSCKYNFTLSMVQKSDGQTQKENIF